MAKLKKQEDVLIVDNDTKQIKDSVSNRLNVLLKNNKDDHLNFEERVTWKISTGSLLLDSACNGIGPSLIRLAGQNQGGKSSQSLEILRNFLLTIPNARAMYILAEGRLSDENKNRSGLKFITNPEEWEDGSIFVLESNIYEFIISVIKDLVLNNPEKKIYAFCIDSVDGLILRQDYEDKTPEEAYKVAGPQVLSKKMLQALSLRMFKYGHLMILISQVTTEVKIDPYAKTPNRGGNFSGGNALLHWADFILEFHPTSNQDFILDKPSGRLNDGKSKPIGKFAKVTLTKSTVEKSFKQLISYPIKYGKKPSGIWTELEISDLLFAFELLKQAGAWISVNISLINELKEKNIEIPEKFHGINEVRDYLENNPNATSYLYDKFKNIVSNDSR